MSQNSCGLKQQARIALNAIAQGANDNREQNQDIQTLEKALNKLPNTSLTQLALRSLQVIKTQPEYSIARIRIINTALAALPDEG